MPRKFSRYCDNCGDYYEGRGKKYCSPDCAQEAQKKESEEQEPFEDIPPEGEREVNRNENDGELMVSVTARQSDAVKTLEQLLEVSEVDLDVWEVSQHETRSWNAFYKDEERNKAVVVPMFSVSARFKRREDAGLLKTAENAITKMENHAPSYADIPNRPKLSTGRQNMLEFALNDIHLGMLAHGQETGENYDSKIAVARTEEAVNDLLQRAQVFGVEKILLVLNGDFFHIDKAVEGSAGATSYGTFQDTDSRRFKMVERGSDLLIKIIDQLLGVAPVRIEIAPGNHDQRTSLDVGRYLNAWYRNTDEVQVNTEPKSRKYIQYGKNLIGICHGQKESRKDLPMIMAVEEPKKWADTKWREWHTAHQHRKKQISMLSVDEEKGVRVRVLPALAGIDSWHYENGYVGNIRSTQCFVWNKEKGLQHIFYWNLR